MKISALSSLSAGDLPSPDEDLSCWLRSLTDARQGAAMMLRAAHQRRPDVVKALCEQGYFPNRLAAEETRRLRLMTDTVMAAPKIFHPSKFWQTFNENAIAHLRIGGLENFKRSINQMYCNFVPHQCCDPQIAALRGKLRGRQRTRKSHYRIDHPDDDPNIWFTFYDSYRFFSGDPRRLARLYLLLVGSMYEYLESQGLGEIFAGLPEPEIGNPVRIWRNDVPISQDVATSVDEFAFIRAHTDLFDRDAGRFHGTSEGPRTDISPRPVVGEIGAGYGRLGYVFLRRTSCRYWVFDIPPALLIAEWYLSCVFPDRKIFRFRPFGAYEEIKQELSEADIAFFTPDQLKRIPDRQLDLAMNISSLHEMTPRQIKHFIDLFDRKSNRFVYLKQYYEYHNPHDGLVLTRKSYEFPLSWKIRGEAPSALNPRFFQMLIEKDN